MQHEAPLLLRAAWLDDYANRQASAACQISRSVAALSLPGPTTNATSTP